MERISIWEEEKQKQHLTHNQYKQNLEIEEYLCDQHDAIVKHRQEPRVYEYGLQLIQFIWWALASD